MINCVVIGLIEVPQRKDEELLLIETLTNDKFCLDENGNVFKLSYINDKPIIKYVEIEDIDKEELKNFVKEWIKNENEWRENERLKRQRGRKRSMGEIRELKFRIKKK